MTPDDMDEIEELDEDDPSGKKVTPGRHAEANLKRARKVAGRALDDDVVKSRFLLEEARIRAMLDVAEALRGN